MESLKLERQIIREPSFLNPMIEEVILVGLSDNCRCISSKKELKWITSLQIISQRQHEEELLKNYQANTRIKYVELGNEYYLKIWFCQKHKKPITKIKSGHRSSNPELHSLAYPDYQIEEDYLCYMVNASHNGKLLIQDVQMVEIKEQDTFKLPQGDNYEIVRLPSPCQRIQKEEYSNSEEHMISKTKYLFVKTIDLEDQEHSHVQTFEPKVIYQHSMKGKNIQIHYSSFHEFCFPEGVMLHHQIIGYGYSIFNFILTQEDGTRIYVNCLKFKQKLEDSILQSLPSNCIDTHIHNHQLLFSEKVICLLSKYCYTQFFHNLLEQLFRKYQTEQLKRSSKYIPKNYNSQEVQFQPILLDFIEKYQIGFRESQRRFLECEYLKEDIPIQMEWDGKNVVFPLPKEKYSSFYSPKAVHCLFKMLSVDKIVEVVEALLLEKTVIFVSQSQVAVGYVIQSLVSFLYPLKWEHVILPLLPFNLLKMLEAPVPLIAGIPQNLASDDLVYNLKEESIIVFLDCNDIIHKDRQLHRINHIKEAAKKLRVYDIYVKNHVSEMLHYMDQFYLFKIHEKEEQNHFSAEHIKHIFFEMVLNLLQNYKLFYINQNNNMSTSNPLGEKAKKKGFNHKKDYRLNDFIRSHSKSNFHFMKKFTESSHFLTFLYNYNGQNENFNKLFIDSAMKKQNHLTKELPTFEYRHSDPHYASTLEVNELKKKSSWPNNHNITWSPPPKKTTQSTSTDYPKTVDRHSMRSDDIQFERQKSMSQDHKKKPTPGGNICDAIARAMTHMSQTKKNLVMWTSARVKRLKKQFVDHKQAQNEEERQDPKVDKQKADKQNEKVCDHKLVREIEQIVVQPMEIAPEKKLY